MIGERRNLKYRINWNEAREAILGERFKGPKLRFDPDIKTKTASDFSKRVKEGEYEYGRKTTEIFSGFLDRSAEVLEIGPGPGTVTVPLSKRVKMITAVDLSLKNIAHLEENLREESCDNVDVIHKNWLRTDDEALRGRYDLVFCSHFLWMIPDLEEHLEKMENASKKYCAVVQPAGRGDLVKEVYSQITGREYAGEFEPDGDYFAYVILREWGRLLNVTHFSFTNTMTLEEKVRSTASFIGRFVEVDEDVAKRIRDLILPHADADGTFVETNNVVVMWWETA
ncbi:MULTISPECIES: class I SAM-dependent methyltransferase [unclassified Methanoculleus]|jgi:ubiquinone/menaquinone biosynthesis C-methylase UbiE|uniref:Class I SAM-dependent methyltransferase n=1 Tax=Methanoculleus palmolei TaxID=72612 RepID=A0ABD8AA27_9EURY|nr:class I SAM-dependent methyltransferase [Methanoculleus sp. UBA377]WOX56369.1 class I SAM-dependent methyltransferase [Methanoculleus palmolei]